MDAVAMPPRALERASAKLQLKFVSKDRKIKNKLRQFSTTINDVYKTEFATLQGFKLEDYYPDQQEWKSGNEEKIRFILENR